MTRTTEVSSAVREMTAPTLRVAGSYVILTWFVPDRM
jgi:hypothetical protein